LEVEESGLFRSREVSSLVRLRMRDRIWMAHDAP
jgi:hypothetical protein